MKCDTKTPGKTYRDPALSCHSWHELDMKTVVFTGGAVPINQLRQHLECPAYGSREILVFFEVPNGPTALA